MFDPSDFVNSDEFSDEFDTIDLIAMEIEFSNELSVDPDELDDIPY